MDITVTRQLHCSNNMTSLLFQTTPKPTGNDAIGEQGDFACWNKKKKKLTFKSMENEHHSVSQEIKTFRLICALDKGSCCEIENCGFYCGIARNERKDGEQQSEKDILNFQQRS